ncbi:MAG TPA: hypothetical protein VK553_06720 [Candidatus Nitrosopolaris rasttigaisensis]|nr:hypothetical protein [Candidatus Nitrosopolaris rasttigaisensis]
MKGCIPKLSLRHFGAGKKYCRTCEVTSYYWRGIYFVSLEEWVPQSTTYIIREKDSDSLVGISKVSDGFNIW